VEKQDMMSWLSQAEVTETIRTLAPLEFLDFHGRVLEYKTAINVDTTSTSLIMDKAKIVFEIAASLEKTFYKEDKM